MKERSLQAYLYIEANVVPDLEYFVYAYTSQHMILGFHSTQRTESMNGILKNMPGIRKSSSLLNLIQAIDTFNTPAFLEHEARYHKSLERVANPETSSSTSSWKAIIEPQITKFAFNAISDQVEFASGLVSTNVTNLPSFISFKNRRELVFSITAKQSANTLSLESLITREANEYDDFMSFHQSSSSDAPSNEFPDDISNIALETSCMEDNSVGPTFATYSPLSKKWNCSCQFFSRFRLPCAHIIASNKMFPSMQEVNSYEIHPRWFINVPFSIKPSQIANDSDSLMTSTSFDASSVIDDLDTEFEDHLNHYSPNIPCDDSSDYRTDRTRYTLMNECAAKIMNWAKNSTESTKEFVKLMRKYEYLISQRALRGGAPLISNPSYIKTTKKRKSTPSISKPVQYTEDEDDDSSLFSQSQSCSQFPTSSQQSSQKTSQKSKKKPRN